MLGIFEITILIYLCFSEISKLIVDYSATSFFFPFIFICWRLITLQYCSGFCRRLTWISRGFTCVPHPDPPSRLPLHPIPLGLRLVFLQDKGSHPEQSQMLVLESCYKIFQPSHSKIEFSFYPIWQSSRTTRGDPKGKTGNDVNPPSTSLFVLYFTSLSSNVRSFVPFQ